MTLDAPHRPTTQVADEALPTNEGPDDYFSRLVRGAGHLPTTVRAALVLYIVGGLVALCALVFMIAAYVEAKPDDVFPPEIIFVLTGPMFMLSAILGSIGLYLTRDEHSDGKSGLDDILRASNRTPTL